MVNSKHVYVLREGDAVPDIDGFLDQGNVVSFLTDYIDNNKINIGKNDVIYLFELGTTNTKSAAADFQDLVVLVRFKPVE